MKKMKSKRGQERPILKIVNCGLSETLRAVVVALWSSIRVEIVRSGVQVPQLLVFFLLLYFPFRSSLSFHQTKMLVLNEVPKGGASL